MIPGFGDDVRSLSFAQIYLYLSIQIYPSHILYIYILYRFIYLYLYLYLSKYIQRFSASPILLRLWNSPTCGSSRSSNVATQKSVMEIQRESHGIYTGIYHLYIIYISFIYHLYIIYISCISDLHRFIYIYIHPISFQKFPSPWPLGPSSLTVFLVCLESESRDARTAISPG